MVAKRAYWRLLKIALLVAIPLESINLWLLNRAQSWGVIDLHGPIDYLKIMANVELALFHAPAFVLLNRQPTDYHSILIQAFLFGVGYVDLVLVCFVSLLVFRVLGWFISTRYFRSSPR